MPDCLQILFGAKDFPARWTCGKWTSIHGWIHIMDVALIWGAYLMLPVVPIYFIRRLGAGRIAAPDGHHPCDQKAG